MNQAIWRGHKVEVVHVSATRAVIITPCEIRLAVRTCELRTATSAPKPKKDSRKF